MSANGKHKREKLSLLANVKLGFNHEEAEFVLGSPQLLAEMVAAKWITPVIKRHKLYLFDRGQLSRAWARILNGEEPPRLVRQPTSADEKADVAVKARQDSVKELLGRVNPGNAALGTGETNQGTS